MNGLRMIMSFLLVLSISENVYSQSSAEVSDQANTQNTQGTFQFETPTGVLLFWKVAFIESLYPEIENRRADSHEVIWHYSADMDIIIFARNIITSSDFVPLESPYNGLKEYKY